MGRREGKRQPKARRLEKEYFASSWFYSVVLHTAGRGIGFTSSLFSLPFSGWAAGYGWSRSVLFWVRLFLRLGSSFRVCLWPVVCSERSVSWLLCDSTLLVKLHTHTSEDTSARAVDFYDRHAELGGFFWPCLVLISHQNCSANAIPCTTAERCDLHQSSLGFAALSACTAPRWTFRSVLQLQ